MNFKQEDIFSMFGIEDEVTKKVEVANAGAQFRANLEKKKEIDSSAVTSPSKKEEPKDVFKLTVNTRIRYGEHEMPVTNYFTVDEIENGIQVKKKNEEEVQYRAIKEEDLRKKLEVDFPILVPNFTTLVYVKNQDVVIPIMQAKKKGNIDCTMETSKNLEVSSTIKKIPYSLLSDFISIARDFSNKYGTEIHADIYFDYIQKSFFMDFPKQRVNRVLVTITEPPHETALKFINRRYKKVMEIHSHHIFRAIPSLTDDENERSSILYAIVGRIDQYFPEITVRTFAKEMQTHISIDPSRVFENPFYNDCAMEFYNTSIVEVE